MRDEIRNSQIPPLLVVQEWARSIKNKSNVKCNFFETASDIPDPQDLNSENKNLMIFDDLLLERQNKCECYYIRGRHSNVHCFLPFTKLPKQTVRENANFICLFPQDLKNIHHIYNDHVGDDMTKEEFRKFSRKCWEKPHVNLVYLPITLDTIDILKVSITDQNDYLLNLRNEKLTIRFHIREARLKK